MKTYGNSKKKIVRLRRLYISTKFAYLEANKAIESGLNDGTFSKKDDVLFENQLLARSPVEMRSKLKQTFPEMLRESLFVRLMSIFEEFLVDALKELASKTTEPFKSQKVQEFHIAQLLSISDIAEFQNQVILKEIRESTSGNLTKIRTYFRNQLGVDFSRAGVDLSRLDEMYERRNILVHAAGAVDNKYFNKYNQSHPEWKMKIGQTIRVFENYLFESIDLIDTLMDYVKMEFNDKWSVSDRPEKKVQKILKRKQEEHILKGVNREIFFRVNFKDDSTLKKFLEDNFKFGFGGKEYVLSSIIVERKILSESQAEWRVSGDMAIVGMYRGYMKRLYKKSTMFTEFECELIPKIKVGA